MLGLSQAAALAVHYGSTREVKNLFVSNKVNQPQRGEPQNGKVKKAVDLTLAAIINERETDPAENEEKGSGHPVPKVSIRSHSP